MASLFSWLNGPIAPKHIPTDTIIPLHSRDDTFQNRSISVEFTMRFDSALDAQKLANALWKLLDRPGWRKLGARLRLNADDKLEYHIPAQYTALRPPMNYTHVKHNMRMSEHKIGAQIPVAKDTSELQVFDVMTSLRGLTQTRNSTAVLADWIYTDKAQLGLHVVSFEDATLVTITWLHTLLDAMGRQALLRAWQAVLEARDDAVPEFWGYDFDPLEKLGSVQNNDASSSVSLDDKRKSPQPKKYISAPSNFSSIKAFFNRLFNFTIRFLDLRSLIYTPPTLYGGRILCMPASYLTRLRTDALRDLSSLDPTQVIYNNSDPQDPKPFLSDGDILSAWLTRLMISSSPALLSSPNRPMVLINVLGMRDVLSTASGGYSALIPRGKAYIGNCTTGIVSAFSMHQFLNLPFGHAAAKLRKDLVAQSSRKAVEASQRAQEQTQDITRSKEQNEVTPAVFVFTNWAKARLFETDFSAAIIGGGHGRGRPSYIHVYGTDVRGMTGSGIGNCIGKDGKGNYWIGVILPREDVEAFDKAVSGLQ
jgi:hypothetical protein